MKKKKRSFLFSFLLILALLISGCSSTGSNADGKDGSGGSEGKNGDEEVTLTMWIWDSAKKPLELLIEDFEKEYPNINIEFQLKDTGDLYQAYLIAANANDQVPDLLNIETSNIAQMVAIDSLYDMTELVEPYKDKINAFKWEDVTKGGKLFAMPWDSGPVVMYYRTDIFEQAGLPTEPEEVVKLVQTFEDYEEIGKAIADKTDAYLMTDSKERSNHRFFETMMWQQGLWYFDKNGDVQLDSPEVKEIGEYFVNLVEKGYVFNAEPWGESWLNAIGGGKVATIVGASWFDGLLPSWIDPKGSGKWRAVPMPKWNVDDKYLSANDGGSNMAINKNSKHPEEAWKFIEFMLGREESQSKMFIEGGFFPSLETTYDSPDVSKPVEYFGGQPVRELYVEVADKIYPQPYTEDFPLANQIMTDAFGEIFFNGKSVDEVFDQYADEIRSRTNRK
jgi:lactose/L-arabinose transport system substrate-binding protein